MNNVKKLSVFDSQYNTDSISTNKIWARGEVIFKELGTENVLLKVHNKVVIAGSQLVAQKCFNIQKKIVRLPSYNTSLVLDNSDPIETENLNNTSICLFCCGTGGSNTGASTVNPVSYTGRISPDEIVPFRFITADNDLTIDDRNKYFGRKTTNDLQQHIAYYFKKFENDPTITMRFTDGTSITEDLYESNIDVGTGADIAETFVEMKLSITKDDFRDYFNFNNNELKNINSISLVTAYPKIDTDQYTYYQDIQPFTQLNIPNESLQDSTKGIDITYHIYF